MNFKTKLNLEYHQARKEVIDEFEKSIQGSNEEYEVFLEEVDQLFIGGKFRREFFKCKTQALIMLNKEHEAARKTANQVGVSIWFTGDDRNLPTFN